MSRLPTLILMRCWPGLPGMASRATTGPVRTRPSVNAIRTTRDGQKKPRPFTRIRPISPITLRSPRASAPPVSQMNGSPLVQTFLIDPTSVPLKASSQVAVLPPQAKPHDLGDRVEGEGQTEQEEGGEKEHPKEGAPLGSLREFHRDVGGQGP